LTACTALRLWPVDIGRFVHVSLEDRLEHQLGIRLHDPIAYRRQPQRAFFAAQ
jgi:hypothetical protein